MYDFTNKEMGIIDMRVVGTFSNEMLNMLKEIGVEVDAKDIPLFDTKEIIEKVRGYDCWVNFGHVCPETVIKALSKDLKMICRCGIGYDQIDMEAATGEGICVTNTAGSMNESVGETTILLILELMRKFYLYNRLLIEGKWSMDIPANSLINKTIGFVGFGGIGQECAELLKGFSCRLLVYDKYIKEDVLRKYGAEAVDLYTLAENADVVTIHCPLTEETKGLINSNFMKKMKRTAYIVNTARGAIINEQDLIEALRQGIIAGAGLDVYEKEPVAADNPLLHMKNVIAVPHIGSRTAESQLLTQIQAVENIKQFISGQLPQNCLNPGYQKNI